MTVKKSQKLTYDEYVGQNFEEVEKSLPKDNLTEEEQARRKRAIELVLELSKIYPVLTISVAPITEFDENGKEIIKKGDQGWATTVVTQEAKDALLGNYDKLTDEAKGDRNKDVWYLDKLETIAIESALKCTQSVGAFLEDYAKLRIDRERQTTPWIVALFVASYLCETYVASGNATRFEVQGAVSQLLTIPMLNKDQMSRIAHQLQEDGVNDDSIKLMLGL